jgi:tetratricopeptide (TPR) repeat protein
MKKYNLILGLILPAWLLVNTTYMIGTPTTAGAEGNIINQTTPALYYGRPFLIKYELDKSPLEKYAQNIRGISALIFTNPLNPPEILDMEFMEHRWQAYYTLTDTSVKMLLFAFQAKDSLGLRNEDLLDNNGGEYWDALVYGQDGTPVRGAHQARALSYTGMGGWRGKDLRQAYTEIKNELSVFPDNLPARSLMYSIVLSLNEYDSTTRRKIEREIDSYLDEHPDDEQIVNFAINAYRMIGLTDKAKDLEDKLVERNPKSNQAAMKSLDEIMKLEDTEVRAERLGAFLDEFPDSRLTEFALSGLATATIEQDDSTEMVSIGDRLMEKASTPISANSLAGLAGVLSEKGYQLARASAYASKALSLILSAKTSPRPPEMSDEEWQNRLQTTEARFRDILGWIYVKQGKTADGLSELREAVKGTSQPGVYLHLASALERSGDTDESLLNYARAAAYEGEIGEMAYQDFYELWTRAGKDTSQIRIFLDREAEWIKNHYKRRVLAERNVRPAPDFELEDMNGRWVRLSDQKGTIVVLCFWASWSRSSWDMLKALHTLSRTYGQDILFLTIATDVEYSTVNDYVKKRNIYLPVVLNDDTDQDYGIQGVPTLFVIDAEGNIHFEHRGYQPEIMEMLTIELEDLIASGKK